MRFDTAWISSSVVFGDSGLGVLGADIPGTGEHGASILYNDIGVGEGGDEFRALILTTPPGGTVFFYEDGSFEATGYPDGTHTGTYQGFKNGVSYGTASYGFQVGLMEPISGSGELVAADDVVSSSGAVGSAVAGFATITNADDQVVAVGDVPLIGTGAVTNTDDTAQAEAWSGVIEGSGDVTETGDVVSTPEAAVVQGGGSLSALFGPQLLREMRRRKKDDEEKTAEQIAESFVAQIPAPKRITGRISLGDIQARKLPPPDVEAIAKRTKRRRQEEELLLL